MYQIPQGFAFRASAAASSSLRKRFRRFHTGAGSHRFGHGEKLNGAH
jgi:hypothetical protein